VRNPSRVNARETGIPRHAALPRNDECLSFAASCSVCTVLKSGWQNAEICSASLQADTSGIEQCPPSFGGLHLEPAKRRWALQKGKSAQTALR
jgi:hypothetical protein